MKGQGEKKKKKKKKEEEFKKFSEKYFLVFGKCYKENQKNKHSTQIDARRSTGFDGAEEEEEERRRVQKIFRKIFSGVWKMLQGKPEKQTQHPD